MHPGVGPERFFTRLSTVEEENMILDEYPKSITLKDGSSVTLRPMVKQDEKALLDFFGSLSKADMLYLRDDVANANVIKNWANNIDYDRVLPILEIGRASCRDRV